VLQRESYDQGDDPWFRGHASSRWELKSTLHRFIESCWVAADGRLKLEVRREMLREEYKAIYHDFKADAWALLEPHQRGEWSLIFAMQHHALPTRLLDWTKSFACALFFAQRNRVREEDAAIFVMNPSALNRTAAGVNGQISLDDELIVQGKIPTHLWHPKAVAPEEDLPSIAVAPILTNRRMVAQRAAFTVSGDSFEALDRQYPGIVSKIVLPSDTYDDAERFLKLVGVGPFGYFPDLEGLAQRFAARRDRLIREITAEVSRGSAA
jgi:hypothetical protein